MSKPLIMTPGPTYIHEEVRKSLAQEITNPDLGPEFFDFYQDTCQKLQQLMNTENEVLVLSGEGILGLEAACASLIEPGDKVLCIDNGIFGNGFGDFAEIYGAEITYFKSDYQKAVNPNKLEEFLEENHDFKLATLVHCETPSGVTNPIDQICPLLKEYGIISVVDSVSAVGGEKLKTDDWQVDIVLGGSQKCLSAPPGLTFLSISDKAWEQILNRETSIASFYGNLATWKEWYDKKYFPYTQPISNIYGLHRALKRILAQDDPVAKHNRIATTVRKSITDAGLELYPITGAANTVTAINLPAQVSFAGLYQMMLDEHNIMIADSLGSLKGEVFRIGHMGENCQEEKLYLTLKALDLTLRSLNVDLKGELHKLFVSYIDN